ncbi:hypothetical protein EKO04_011622 [Ascochyta lentis]|uniref:Uncharacterized protein n=1 Tax=Ascochyta lentis TaxID=205686 RepID=A0A8H7MEP3_9PLEO|nr:hypothetical protein EKO04_011622 [Ascochyta lentis]
MEEKNQKQPAHMARSPSDDPKVRALRRPVDKSARLAKHFQSMDEALGTAVDQETYMEAGQGEHPSIVLAQKLGEDRMAQKQGEDRMAQKQGEDRMAQKQGRHQMAQKQGRHQMAQKQGRHQMAQKQGRHQMAQAQVSPSASPASRHGERKDPTNLAAHIKQSFDEDHWVDSNEVGWIVDAEETPIEAYANTSPGVMPPFPFEPTPEQISHYEGLCEYWIDRKASFRDLFTGILDGPDPKIDKVRGRSATTAVQTANGVRAEAEARRVQQQ